MSTQRVDRIGGLAADIAIKAPCRAATTGGITLSGLQTIDGVALASMDRVLAKNQADPTMNGVYLASTGPWIRDTDFDGARDVTQGTIVFIFAGSTNSGFFFQLTSANPIIIGSTALTFAATSIPTISAAMAPIVAALTVAVAQSLLGINPLDPAFTNLVYTPAGFTTSAIFVGDGGRNLLHTAGLEGYYNTSLGYQCLTSLTKGSYNTAIGFESMQTTTTGNYNTGCGEATLIYNVTGNGNTSLGWKAKLGVSGGLGTGDYNTCLGYSAGLSLDGGNQNTLVGEGAGGTPFGWSGNSNTVVGAAALSANGLTTASHNVIFGDGAGASITTGSGNVIVGPTNSGGGLTTGSNNVVIGNYALAANAQSTIVIATGNTLARLIADAASLRVFDQTGATQNFAVNDVGSFRSKQFTVAALPAGSQGDIAYATNGRNTGEGAGAGTGCLVTKNSAGAWAAVWSGAAVTA